MGALLVATGALVACLPDPGARLDAAALHLTVTGLDLATTDLRAELTGASAFEDPGLTRSPRVGAQDTVELFWVTLPRAVLTLRLSTFGVDGGLLQCVDFASAVVFRGDPLNLTVDLETGAPCALDNDSGVDARPVPSVDAGADARPDAPARDAANGAPDARSNGNGAPEKDARVRPDR
jgi:hypothetical protein